jgi:hypothetical protein
MTALYRLVVALAVTAVATVSAQNTISIDSVGVAAVPAFADMTVSLTNDSNLASLRFQLDYDPLLVSVSETDIVGVASHFAESGLTKTTVSVGPGKVVWSVADFTGAAVINAGTGPLLNIRVQALAALQFDSATIAVTGVQAWSTTLNPVTLTPTSGAVFGQVPVVVASTSTSPTSTYPIPFTITFAAPVTGFVATDIQVHKGVISEFVVVSASTYAVAVTPTGKGSVKVTVPAGVATQTDTGTPNSSGTKSIVFNPKFDVDKDSVSNFRDIVFCYRFIIGVAAVADGVTLPAGETGVSVSYRVEMLLGLGDDGFAAADVDRDGAVDIRDMTFIYRRVFGYETVAAGVTLPAGVVEADVNANIDAILLP